MVRIKERYLLVNLVYPDESLNQGKTHVPDLLVYNQPTPNTVTSYSLLKTIKTEVASLFGDYGAGAIERSLQVKYLSHATSTCILRCSREHYRLVWAALTIMDHLPLKNGKPCVFRVVRVSGTIRKVEEEAIRRARQMVLAAKDAMAGKESGALDSLFGASKDSMKEVTMVDVSDNSGSEAEDDDGGWDGID